MFIKIFYSSLGLKSLLDELISVVISLAVAGDRLLLHHPLRLALEDAGPPCAPLRHRIKHKHAPSTVNFSPSSLQSIHLPKVLLQPHLLSFTSSARRCFEFEQHLFVLDLPLGQI